MLMYGVLAPAFAEHLLNALISEAYGYLYQAKANSRQLRSLKLAMQYSFH